MNQNGLEKIRNCSIELRTYSKNVLGYRFFMPDGSTYYVLNDLYSSEDTRIVFDELRILSEKYIESGFVMLLEDGSIHVDKKYVYMKELNEYRFKSDCKEENIINFHAYKYYYESLKKRGLIK